MIFRECFENYDFGHANCKSNDEITKACKGVTNHEMAHVFNINQTQSDGGDNRCEWMFQTFSPVIEPGLLVSCVAPPVPCANPVQEGCLMNRQRPIWNSPASRFTLLDAHDLLCGDPGCPCAPPICLNDHTANWCAAGTAECVEVGNGSIRQVIDPKYIWGIFGNP